VEENEIKEMDPSRAREEKMDIVLEGLKEKRSVAEICRGQQSQVKSARVYFIDGGISF